MSDRVWYVVERNQQIGPLDEGEVRERLRLPDHGPGTPVWTEGMPDWAPAGSVDAFGSFFTPSPATPQHAGTQPPPPGPEPGPVPGSVPPGHHRRENVDDTAVFLAVGCHVANLFTLPWNLLGVIAIIMDRDPLSKYHGVQAVTAFVVYLVASIAVGVVGFVTCGVGFVLLIPVVVLYYVDTAFGIVYAAQRRRKPVPITGRLAESFFGPAAN